MPLLRILCPPDRTERIVAVLRETGADEVSVFPGVGRSVGADPIASGAVAGGPVTEGTDTADLIMAELPRARIDALLARVGEEPPEAGWGALRVAVEPSLRLLPKPAPAADDEAVVWAEVVHDIHAAARWSPVNLLLIIAAAAIAAIGILQDQLLLIVGAMALSPDYYPIADTALALSRRAWAAAGRAARSLAGFFAAAVAGAWLLAEALAVTGLAPRGGDRLRDLTLFIASPDPLSVVVALTAGAAGALAITLPGARGLVGVFVSITTIPAAANIGVAVAARDPGELAGAGVQLLVNVTSLLVAGTVTLLLRHRGRAPRRVPPSYRHHPPHHW